MRLATTAEAVTGSVNESGAFLGPQRKQRTQLPTLVHGNPGVLIRKPHHAALCAEAPFRARGPLILSQNPVFTKMLQLANDSVTTAL